MKNLFFCLLATMTLMTIGCSDPCDDLNCGTGTCIDGTCDCPDGFSGVNCEIQDLCFNSMCGNGTCNSDTGACECDEGYEGEQCESAQRDKFIGLWNSSDWTCDDDDADNLTLNIEAGDGILDVKVTDPEESDLIVNSVVNGSTFTITPQILIIDGIDVMISGSGNVVDGVMTLSITQSVPGFGEATCTGTFVQ